MSPKEALELAITKAGTQAQLAARIGLENRQNITNWLLNGGVPAKHCPAIERETGVRCEDLCPDADWGVLRGSAPAQRETEPSPSLKPEGEHATAAAAPRLTQVDIDKIIRSACAREGSSGNRERGG